MQQHTMYFQFAPAVDTNKITVTHTNSIQHMEPDQMSVRASIQIIPYTIVDTCTTCLLANKVMIIYYHSVIYVMRVRLL